MKANEVFDDRDGPEQGGTDTEDGICRQLVSGQAIPHAKVEANGHEDAVENNKRPEPEDGLLADSQRVFQRRRAAEIGVIVGDLGVWIDVVWVWRRCSAGIGTGIQARSIDGRGAARLALIVAGTVDGDAGDLERAGRRRVVLRCVCWRRWPQWLCRGLLGGHGGESRGGC